MREREPSVAPTAAGSRWSSFTTSAFGALIGGLVGAAFVVVVTLLLKAGMDFVARQATWLLILLPLIGLSLGVLVLQGLGRTEGAPAAKRPRWRTFPRGAIQADITGDVIDTAGEEERFPWRLAPIRTLAIIGTVGFGAAMGTEAPAAYLGVAAGACLGDRGGWWRRLLRPAALGGGAAGVAALMAIPFVGAAYMLELGRRHNAGLSGERIVAALVGGLIGWGINVAFHLNLIRLIVPKEPPSDLAHALITAVFIGALSGGITSVAGWTVYRAKKWRAAAGVRLAVGGLATLLAALILVVVAEPAAAVGPGGGAILWAENNNALPMTLLIVALLRAAATTAVVAAGGCGGVFVPFLAVGDLSGRVFAPALDLGNDLTGAAGAAAGIAGGYHLPLTAVAMVLWLGGPPRAMVTCLATVIVAFLAGAAVEAMLNRLEGSQLQWRMR